MTPAGARRCARHAARLTWLRAHPAWLASLPAADEPPTREDLQALARVHRAMVADGLYAETSDGRATRWGIRRCVSELRGRPILLRRRWDEAPRYRHGH